MTRPTIQILDSGELCILKDEGTQVRTDLNSNKIYLTYMGKTMEYPIAREYDCSNVIVESNQVIIMKRGNSGKQLLHG